MRMGSGLNPLRAWLWTALALSAPALAIPPLGLPPLPVVPSNPQSAAKIQLGDKLFHDPRFSSTGEISCQSCHLDPIAFHDGRAVAKGVNRARGTRNAPTIINAAYLQTLFWDGRASSLEKQAIQPLLNPIEHGLQTLSEGISVIVQDSEYPSLFRKAFQVDAANITMEHFAKAVAAYERTLIFANSAFDRWYFNGEKNALSASAQRGFAIFSGRGHCSACHIIEDDYALFTDDEFHNANVGFSRLTLNADGSVRKQPLLTNEELDHAVLTNQEKSELGRYGVTHNLSDLGAFKTPSLRNVARTAPYLHDGSLTSLEQVVSYFNNGGKLDPADPGPNPYRSPLILSLIHI